MYKYLFMIYPERGKNGEICANSWPKRHLYAIGLGVLREYTNIYFPMFGKDKIDFSIFQNNRYIFKNIRNSGYITWSGKIIISNVCPFSTKKIGDNHLNPVFASTLLLEANESATSTSITRWYFSTLKISLWNARFLLFFNFSVSPFLTFMQSIANLTFWD